MNTQLDQTTDEFGDGHAGLGGEFAQALVGLFGDLEGRDRLCERSKWVALARSHESGGFRHVSHYLFALFCGEENAPDPFRSEASAPAIARTGVGGAD